MPWEDTASTLNRWQEQYLTDWKYFATDQMVEYNGKQRRGLKLPKPVLGKLYDDNAARWIPGILAGR